MKFPHNTDAFAYHVAALSKCADQADFRAMLAWEREKADTIERGERYGYEGDVVADILADIWTRHTLAKAEVFES